MLVNCYRYAWPVPSPPLGRGCALRCWISIVLRSPQAFVRLWERGPERSLIYARAWHRFPFTLPRKCSGDVGARLE